MKKKVDRLLQRYDELEKLLADPEVFQDPKVYRDLTREHSYLSEIKNISDALQKTTKLLQEDQEFILEEKDVALKEMLKDEIESLTKKKEELEIDLENLLVPPDPEDDRNVIMELRAGTGGDEAALFVGDCVRMYQLYASQRGWKFEVLTCSPAEVGGFKECIMVFGGPKVKRYLQYEGGTHRVQRVPATEAQGRIHTSAITIAVLLEPTEEEEVKIDEKDLRIDTYRASGAGGQHVNVTDSAVRITHIPTNIIVSCQDERSQHKNKDKALRLLGVKLADLERRKREEAEASLRAAQVGTGDRSERIRTYNFPQNRITDHRINLTLYSLDKVMEGDLDALTNALVKHFYQQKLAE